MNGCKCISQVNKQLEPYNTALSQQLVMNFKNGKARLVLQLATHKIESKSRKPCRTVLATFCPFCGKKLDKTNRNDVA